MVNIFVYCLKVKLSDIARQYKFDDNGEIDDTRFDSLENLYKSVLYAIVDEYKNSTNKFYSCRIYSRYL